MEMYAKRKGWDIGGVEVDLRLHARRARLPDPLQLVLRFPDEPHRGAGRAPAGHRRQVPGPPHARRRGHVRRACRARHARALSSRAQLRAVLLDPEEAAALDVHGRIDAAVLVPLYLTDGELHAVFTRRRDDMRRHAGEISFPGGRQDDDETDLRLTALREAEEEIGLPPDEVELVGALQPTPTIATNYAVYPFVGLIEPGRDVAPVGGRGRRGARVPAARGCATATRAAACCAAACRSGPTPTCVGDHLIWGATARMVGDLLERVPDDLQT